MKPPQDSPTPDAAADAAKTPAPAEGVQLACKVLQPCKVGTHIRGRGARVKLPKDAAEELEKRGLIEVIGLA